MDAELSRAVLDKLSEISPREMRKALLDGLGFAVAASRVELLPDDVRVKSEGGKRRIGF